MFPNRCKIAVVRKGCIFIANWGSRFTFRRWVFERHFANVSGVIMLNKRNAFTLYELIIAIALLAVVAGVVLSFVSFLGDYTSRNEVMVEQNNQTLALRREVDKWFSYFDTADTEFTLGGTDVVATATYQGIDYNIRMSEVDGNLKVQFSYPEGTVDVTATLLDSIVVATDGTTVANPMGDSVRFVINCKVSGNQFVCQLVFK